MNDQQKLTLQHLTGGRLSDQEFNDLLEYIEARDIKSRNDGLEQAAMIVLRRTEIPKDAKNPTRDYVVLLGEEIAGLIRRYLTNPHKASPEEIQ